MVRSYGDRTLRVNRVELNALCTRLRGNVNLAILFIGN